ncbi:MAG TPA: formate dehydrogenase subunit gamma [Gemmatimonadaceae bacterium]|nr:formate dehydrogenase subunit gamma [Gemmatimonadaceae bacterium]
MDLEPVVEDVVRQFADTPGALLPILHGVQHAVGYIPREAVPRIAAALNLSRAEVHGVVSFYHEFRDTPAGRHTLKICRAESCQAVGAEALVSEATSRAGIALGGTSADGQLTVEPIYCLGLCALSPAIMVDDQVHARVTPAQLDAILDAVLEPGPVA